MHFPGNGSVQHGFQISPDGGQRRSEIVGYIGYKFFLVILGACNFTGHIIQTGGQVADFIIAFHLEFIMHVAGSILLCGICDFPQGNIHDLCKKNQNDQ